jgi:formate dehydrogenase major subunit
MDPVTLTIDGRAVTVPADATILDAATKLGIEVPTLCYHSMLVPFTSCWICVVEWVERGKLVPACSTKVSVGMTIETASERVRSTRKLCLELLLSDHCGDCEGACRVRCPAGCDVQGYLTHIANGADFDAVRTIKETLALPAALGRICPHPCEAECRRQRVDEPVAICALKRFAADVDLANERPFRPAVAAETGKRLAVVGAGPAGLACAYYARQRGHAVTVFDAQPEPGGMLRYGIPEFRLSRDVLAREIEQIAALGVTFEFGRRFGRDLTLDGLRQAGFGAVFLGLGAWRSSALRCEGEDDPRVLHGIHFLERVAKGERVSVGRRVAVVGGGNTAMDACRTAMRLVQADSEDHLAGPENGVRPQRKDIKGSAPIFRSGEVTVLYRRTRQEMPANPPEIDAALREGVKIEYLVAPIRIERRPGEGLSVTCIRMGLGEPDASGRRRPVPIPGSEFELVVDTLIAAIGQAVESRDLAGTGLAVNQWGCVEVDPKTLTTNLAGVFAGGDCVSGPGIAVEAVAAGRLAAVSIDQYLRGQPVVGAPAQFVSQMGGSLEEAPEERFAGVAKAPRAAMPELEPERLHTFEEVEKGFDEATARREAARCLVCGCKARDDCKLRLYATQYEVDPKRLAGESRSFERDESHAKLAFELGKCINCGNCVRVCKDVKGLEVLSFAARGFGARVRPIFGRPLANTPCDGCLKCVEVCPTGAVFAKLSAPEPAKK